MNSRYTSPFPAHLDPVWAKPEPVPWNGFETGPADTCFYPERFVAALQHPALAKVGVAERVQLTVWRLLAILTGSANDELFVVNDADGRLANDPNFFAGLQAEARADCGRVVVEEALHAWLSLRCARRVTEFTGIEAFVLHAAHPSELETVLASVPPPLRPCAAAVYTCVIETLVSSTLSEAPRDRTVREYVRGVLALHAREEGVHNVFHEALLRRLWRELAPSERRTIGVLVPRFIELYLGDNPLVIAGQLRALGVVSDPVSVGHEVAAATRCPLRLRQCGKRTLRVLRELAFDDGEVEGAFKDARLVD